MKRKILKAVLSLIMAAGLLAPAMAVYSAEPDIIKLTVNGEAKEIRPKILSRDGKIYIPVIAVSQYLFGSFADYNSSSGKIIAVNKNGAIFENKLNTDIIYANGRQIKNDAKSFKESDDYYVTEKFLTIVFGIKCAYNKNKKTVEISQTTETDIKKLRPEIRELEKVAKMRHYQPDYLERYIKYKKKNPNIAYFDVVTYVNIGLDYPFYSAKIVKEAKNPDSMLVLCNKYSRLPANYVPEGYKKADGRVLSLKREAQEQFDKMRSAASKAGISIYIISGYRSYAIQDQVYNNYKKNDPKGADTYSARPGHSEHQTGLAADINVGSSTANFENTKEYAWLVENAHKYGFIHRYQKGKEWITGYIFEPWHWRYVGTEVAKIIKEQDITFDEYYAIYCVPQNVR